MSITDYQALATEIRAQALRMTSRARSSHIGGCLSAADILAVLYGGVLRARPHDPQWAGRDRFIMSKGHIAAAHYAALAAAGFFPRERLETFYQDGSTLTGHVSHSVPGIEAATGALGHGLPIAGGMALAGKRDRQPYRVFVLMSDGDCQEGATWEAAMFAAQHHLDNLVGIIDYNRVQACGSTRDILDLEPLAAKWRSFGWEAQEIDGHDLFQIEEALTAVPVTQGKPACVIARTVKGRGVSFMENVLAWHYRAASEAELKQALGELGVEA